MWHGSVGVTSTQSTVRTPGRKEKLNISFCFLFLNNRRMKQVFLYLTELSDRHCRQLINTNGWITKGFHYQLLCKRTVPLAAVTTTVQGKSPDRSSVDVSSVPVNWFDNRQRWAPVGPQCVWSTCVSLQRRPGGAVLKKPLSQFDIFLIIFVSVSWKLSRRNKKRIWDICLYSRKQHRVPV